jgi:hypothetical protein
MSGQEGNEELDMPVSNMICRRSIALIAARFSSVFREQPLTLANIPKS